MTQRKAILIWNVCKFKEQKEGSQLPVTARDAGDNVCFVTVALQIKLCWIELYQKLRHNKQELMSEY